LLQDFDGPLAALKSPPGSQKITDDRGSGPRVAHETHGRSREPCGCWGYRVGLTSPGSRPRLPGLSIGFRMPRPAMDKCASGWAVLHQFRRPLADLRWTVQVPCGMVPMTARGQEGPITCAVLLTQPVPQRPASAPRGTDRFSGALTPKYRAMSAMMAVGCSAARIGVTRATPDPDGG
jgi:hypothetical protein